VQSSRQPKYGNVSGRAAALCTAPLLQLSYCFHAMLQKSAAAPHTITSSFGVAEMAQDTEHEQALQATADSLLAEQHTLQKRLQQLTLEFETEAGVVQELQSGECLEQTAALLDGARHGVAQHRHPSPASEPSSLTVSAVPPWFWTSSIHHLRAALHCSANTILMNQRVGILQPHQKRIKCWISHTATLSLPVKRCGYMADISAIVPFGTA